MTKPDTKTNKTLLWVRVRPFPGASETTPELPGVYVLGRVQGVRGLPVSCEWVYVGQAVNLRARLRNHHAITEDNHLLRSWLRTTKKDIEVWYTVTPAEHRSHLEREMIRSIEPIFNRIKFKNS